MLSQRARQLKKEFEHLLMKSGCDSDLKSCVEYTGTYGCPDKDIQQAWVLAVLYAAGAHIENCFDTPDSEIEGSRKGGYLDPARYIEWMNEEIADSSRICCG